MCRRGRPRPRRQCPLRLLDSLTRR
jgi:hypothetical protein